MGYAPDDAPPARSITQIEVQKNSADRVSVHIDGDFAFGVHQDLVVKHGLHVGRTLSIAEQQALVEEDRRVKAKQRAFDYLAHKPRTEQEVRRKLQRQGYERAVIEDVVERLYELGYLDDEGYARDYVHNRFANKGYGPVRIRQELLDRGVDRHLAESAVENLFAEEDELQAARGQAKKRWPRLSRENDPRKRKQKLYGYLRRRGFTTDTIYRVIDEMARRAS